MNLLLVSLAKPVERDWSKDRRTGRSGGGTLCSCMLLRMSKLSFSLRAGNVGRTSGKSLGDGNGAVCFECWPVVDRESDG